MQVYVDFCILQYVGKILMILST